MSFRQEWKAWALEDISIILTCFVKNIVAHPCQKTRVNKDKLFSFSLFWHMQEPR